MKCIDRFASFLRVLGLIPVVSVLVCTAAQGQMADSYGKSKASATLGPQIAVFAGGCFWGVDAVFKHVKGVSEVVSGYSGGSAATAQYEVVSTGKTGHVESVKISYDPAQVSYPQLLSVFFSVAHDPTQLNRQGPDIGTQYRSVIFYATEEQKQIALASIEQLTKAAVFSRHIVTQVVPLVQFYPAEEEHQDFVARNPNKPYIVAHDLPKLRRLQQQFPDLYKP